jgi:hypothetical protein
MQGGVVRLYTYQLGRSLMDGENVHCTVAWKDSLPLQFRDYFTTEGLVMIPTRLRSGSSKAEAPKLHQHLLCMVLSTRHPSNENLNVCPLNQLTYLTRPTKLNAPGYRLKSIRCMRVSPCRCAGNPADGGAFKLSVPERKMM